MTASALDRREAGVAHDHVPGRAALAVLFAVYLVVLVWLVLWKLHAPSIGGESMRGLKLTPFVAAEGYGASQPREVLGNIAVFVPFGLYLGLVARSWSWSAVVGVVAATSTALELLQFALAVGATDSSDVIANTAGGLVGFLIAAVVRRSRHAVAALTLVLTAGTALMLAWVAIVVTAAPRLPGMPGGIG